MVWPTRLTIFYPHPMSSLAAWKVLVSAVMLIAISAIAMRFRRQHPYLLAGWMGYLVMLVPVIGLVQVGDQAMADRYAYLPLIAVFIVVVWGTAELALRLHLPGYALAVLGVAVLAALSLDTARQLPYWHDSVSLFSHALEVTDNNYVAEGNLSEALGDLGENEAALPHIRKLLALRPEDPVGYYGLALNKQRSGDCAAAVPQYRRAVDLGKGQQAAERTVFLARAYNNLGVCLRKLGQVEEAKASFADSIRSDPAGFRAYLNLGDILEDEGRHDEAIALFSKSVEISPTDGGYFLMAKALAKENRLREAAEADRRALRISPDNQVIQSHLASVEARMKK
jgi:protein O-mannosyl-transferase